MSSLIYFGAGIANSVYQLSTGWKPKGSNTSRRNRYFFLYAHSGTQQASSTVHSGSVSRGQSGRDAALTDPPHLPHPPLPPTAYYGDDHLFTYLFLFVICLTGMLMDQILYCQTTSRFVINKLKWMCKEAVVPCFELFSQHLS